MFIVEYASLEFVPVLAHYSVILLQCQRSEAARRHFVHSRWHSWSSSLIGTAAVGIGSKFGGGIGCCVVRGSHVIGVVLGKAPGARVLDSHRTRQNAGVVS